MTTPDDNAIERLVLEIAADANPSLSKERCLRQLDEMASALDDGADLDALCRLVYGALSFRGDDTYDDPRCSLLDQVLERRVGSPTALAVVLIAIGRRVGVQLEPVAFPGHFLVRHEDIFMNPADGRHPVPYDALVALATETLGSEHDAVASLQPAGATTVAVRILQNLYRIHRSRADHGRALLACDRLMDLTGAVELHADRGAHALAAGAVRTAVADFTTYLRERPDAPDAPQVRRTLRRARELLASSH